MAAPRRPVQAGLDEFRKRPCGRSLRRLAHALLSEKTVPRALSASVEEAILTASESADWRLARMGLAHLYLVSGHLRRKADILVEQLLSSRESVRVASWIATDGERLSRMVLSRLERKPIPELMVWEVLMAVDWMTDWLKSRRDRDRLVRFVRRLENTPTRSRSVRWKVEDTLYCPLHLDQPRPREASGCWRS